MNIKRILPVVALLVVLIGTRTVRASYSYYYTENMASPTWGNWVTTGSLGVYTYGSYSGVSGNGVMMYHTSEPFEGEVSMTVRIAHPSDWTYFEEFLASDSASSVTVSSPSTNYTMLSVSSTGSLTLSEVAYNSGSSTYVRTTLGSVSATINDHSVVRLIGNSSPATLGAYIDGNLVLSVPWTPSCTYGYAYMGVGISGSTTDGNFLASSSVGQIGTSPVAISSGSISSTSSYGYVDLSWPAASDGAGGSGIYDYAIYRNSSLLGTTSSLSYSDTTVVPDTTYTYTIVPTDFDFQSASTNFSASTAAFATSPPYPSTTPDGRRVGVRSTGAYWGASPETIDVQSGNLSFGVPLLAAQQRGGSGPGFNLIYNSQNWRHDSGGTWLFDSDVGYGFGFRLMAGSIEPKWNSGGTSPAYFIFTDSTGAQYNLNQSSGNIWSSEESVYMWFDANANTLHFRDGSFWVFECVSSGGENDAGTMYPTTMEDTNGNQILIRYNTGASATWSNSSARINQIEDVRAQMSGGSTYTYSFTYNSDSPPHLTSISNLIGSGESYSFSYSSASLSDPFASTSWGTVKELYEATVSATSTYHQFTYNSSGEITKIQLPYGAYLKYDYGTTTYSGPGGTKEYREVTNRYLSKDGTTGSQTTYPFTKDSNPSTDVHSYSQLDDPGGIGQKYWAFNTSGTYEGLTTTYKGNDKSSGTVTKTETDFTWSQDSSYNSYISQTVNTLDPGTGSAAAATTQQTVDTHGNVTSAKNYDYGGSTYKLYNYSYLSTSSYTNLYLFNRTTSATVTTDGTHYTTLASVSYDGSSLSGSATPGEWDASYSSVTARGNPTSSTDVSGITSSSTYDLYGNVTGGTSGSGVSSSVTTGSSTNYAAPSAVTVGSSLTTNLTYNSFLGLTNETGPNSTSVSLGYDSSARPTSSQSPFGAYTYTAYNDTASPPNVCASTNTRWTQTFLDGLGRTSYVLTGTYPSAVTGPSTCSSASGAVTLNKSAMTYDSCGCSPLGKLKSQEIPHVPTATSSYIANLNYTYDGIGRTLSKASVGAVGSGSSPDTQGTTTYSYSGNTVTATDPSGTWKKYTSDAFGNLIQVNEPNPSGGSDYVTTYTYDVLGHLTGMSMTRGSTTQMRSFNYTGNFLSSATNPENGTVNYTYGSNHLVATVIDAKNQETTYTYDSMARLSEVQKYPVSTGSEDTCQRQNYYYDSNPFDGGTYSSHIAGRLAAIRYYGGNTGSGCLYTFQEWYNYSTAGGVVGKDMHIIQGSYPTDLAASFVYDNEGRMTTENYPTDYYGTTGSYSTGYDSMGRLYSLTDQVASQVLVQSATYGAAGELTNLAGNGYWYSFQGETRSYNSLKQLTSLSSNYGSSANLTYTYSATANNGKVTSQYDAISGETVVYTYDSLTRLASAAQSGTWGQSFSYDGFGNLTSISGTGTASSTSNSFSINTSTNHAWCSDANGNSSEVSCAGTYNGYTYDISNRVVTTPSSSPGGTTYYSYDPFGHRVWRGNSTIGNEITFWGPSGQKLATFTLNIVGYATLAATQGGSNVYFGGKLIKKTGPGGAFQYPDRLGSIGKYYPYGTDKGSGNPANGTEKFTGYQRDAETGNDYALSRYMQPGAGRFLTPDKVDGQPSDPGSLNKYAYTRGDPVNRVDSMGTEDEDPDCIGVVCQFVDAFNFSNTSDYCASTTDPVTCLGQLIAIGDLAATGASFGSCTTATVMAVLSSGSLPSTGCGGSPTQTVATPSCSLSLATQGTPEGKSFVGLVPYGPQSNSLGPYNTIGRQGLRNPRLSGWFYAVQIQGTLFGDTDPNHWTASQTVQQTGSATNLAGQVLPYAPGVQTDDPEPFAVYQTTGKIDWLDTPGFSALGVWSANLTKTFVSKLTNIATGASCSITWTEHISVAGGISSGPTINK